MWLPETAADHETLEVLADEGVRFTLLAPSQAAGVRERDGEWRPGAALDPRRAYRWDGSPGRELALFFYDGPISHAVAFDGLLRSGDALAARLLAGFHDDAPHPQLVHIATDGETYGHHHRFGEMALATACARIEGSRAVTLTSHAAFLAAHPPTASARVVEGSSWSCAHGVERWRGDCGCRAGHHPGWHQRWRAPLRAALDWLRDRVDPLYEARAAALLKDPWAARDAYVEVVLDRTPASVATFLERHALRPLDADGRVQALRCLELQRHRLLMYTSCGWFFDEISGIETTQVLRYAARVLQLARALGGDAGLEEELLRRLAAAPSNVPELRDGAGVWRRHVAPWVTDAPRVAAHYALAGLSEGYAGAADVHAFRVERRQWARAARGGASLTVGRVRVTSRVTEESDEADVAVLDVGDGRIGGRVRWGSGADALAPVRAALLRAILASGDRAACERELERQFGGRACALADVFVDERRRLAARLAERAVEEAAGASIETAGRELLSELRHLEGPVPLDLADVARRLLARAARAELGALARGGGVTGPARRLREVFAEARSLGIPLGVGLEEISRALGAALRLVLTSLGDRVTAEAVADALELVALGHALDAPLDLWAAQNTAAGLWRRSSRADRQTLEPLMSGLGFAPGALAGPPPE
jgi:hypothetical protein